jgi:dihydroneopterin aldolase
MTMDQIIIEDLAVDFRVGVPEAERSRPQRLLLTVVMDHDFSRAAAGDDLSRTIDYYAVTQRLLALGAGRQWSLIETLAVEIAELILREFKPARVTVIVKKFVIPEARHVAVKVERAA